MKFMELFALPQRPKSEDARFTVESDRVAASYRKICWKGSIMRKFAIFSALALLLAVGITGFASAQSEVTPETTPEATDAEVAVTLQRDACFGACPVYSVTIYTDGTVVYNGERFVEVEGEQTTTIEPKVVQQLVEGFAEAGYFDWDDEYMDMPVSDLPYVTTSVTRDGVTKTIQRYAGDSSAPLALPYLEAWIDLAAYTSQWTGVHDPLTHAQTSDTPVMTLQRTACFGMCPVYGVNIFEDGTVIYVGVRHVAETGVRIGQADPDQVDFLAMQTAQSGYFEWNDEYTRLLVTDQPSAITSLYRDGQFKSINRYDGDPDAPVGLVRFEAGIDRIANTAQWVNGA